MHLCSSLAATAALPRPENLGAFAKHLPDEWIEQALLATGTATVRKRRLPAEQVVWLVLGMALFRERWELELGYDEIKTEMLEREESIRSKSPAAVAQELWGILLAYNLVRLEMERVADEAGVEPTRISFITALHLVCDEWLWCAVASPGAIVSSRSESEDEQLPAQPPEATAKCC